ncbi:MAG: MarC family protein, partial [Phycisphaerales bacterium]
MELIVEAGTILENAVYFLALINPASKVLMLSSFQPKYSWKEIKKISLQSSTVAFVVLFILVSAGNFILRSVFHVEIYSLQIVGGLTLFLIGMSAITRGRFHRRSPNSDRMKISIVPIAVPLIVGPGTVVAAITFSSDIGLSSTVIALFLALVVNCVIMLASIKLGVIFERLHITEVLIRLT